MTRFTLVLSAAHISRERRGVTKPWPQRESARNSICAGSRTRGNLGSCTTSKMSGACCENPPGWWAHPMRSLSQCLRKTSRPISVLRSLARTDETMREKCRRSQRRSTDQSGAVCLSASASQLFPIAALPRRVVLAFCEIGNLILASYTDIAISRPWILRTNACQYRFIPMPQESIRGE